MEHFLKHLVLWTYFHPHYAGIVVLLIAVSESVAVLGTLVPGSIVMTAIGTLIGAGILPFYATILWAAAGAFAGDSASFIVGYILKDDIQNIWPFSRRKEWLRKGNIFFKRHGRKSIFAARFLGPLRAFVPITAGALHMKRSHFFITDAISAVLWAFVYMLPGMIIGMASLDLPADIAAHFIWWFFLFLAAALVIFWISRLIVIHVSDVLKDVLSILWSKIQRTRSLHWLSVIFKHNRPSHPRGQLGVLAVLLLIIALFITVAINVVLHGPLTHYNNDIFHFFQSLRNIPTDKVMIFFSMMGDKRILPIPCVAALIWLCYKRCWRAAFHWALLVFLAFAGIAATKFFVHNPRPPGLDLSGFSFPSGHSTLSTAIYGMIAYFIASRCPPKLRWTWY